MTFSEALDEQRWDDHRYYHHNRINQALHLVSALSFIAAYVLLAIDPFAAVMLAWLVAMPSRQLGHFWFEPHDYDEINEATHEHKEAIKVGYKVAVLIHGPATTMKRCGDDAVATVCRRGRPESPAAYDSTRVRADRTGFLRRQA